MAFTESFSLIKLSQVPPEENAETKQEKRLKVSIFLRRNLFISCSLLGEFTHFRLFATCEEAKFLFFAEHISALSFYISPGGFPRCSTRNVVFQLSFCLHDLNLFNNIWLFDCYQGIIVEICFLSYFHEYLPSLLSILSFVCRLSTVGWKMEFIRRLMFFLPLLAASFCVY